jgi:transposase
VQRGLEELERDEELAPGRVRRPGAGRKKLVDVDSTLVTDLEEAVEPTTRGDPESSLRWTCKSTRVLARELRRMGHRVGESAVRALLHDMGYSLQANRKTREGRQHPDRNAQFDYIDRSVSRQVRGGGPAISVDTKKKELVGDFKNGGRAWRPRGEPHEVRVHDFLDPALGKAIPYGLYDLGRNRGWVAVGIDHDTAQFAVATIRRWWHKLGRARYPKARSLVIVADGGGSNGPRLRLWKWELQRLADALAIPVRVHHLPPGTSKWNKIEHRLFSFITKNWQGQPLLTHAAIVNLIAATKTRQGLKVHCYLDRRKYPTDVHVTDEQMAEIRLRPAPFHGEWNYSITPRKPSRPAKGHPTTARGRDNGTTRSRLGSRRGAERASREFGQLFTRSPLAVFL